MALIFLLDMGISPKVVEVLQNRGHTAVHVQEIALQRAADRLILEEARRRGATILTTDKDLATHVAVSQANSPTVITMRLDNPTADEQIAALVGLLDALPEADLVDCLVTLERGRYRRRPLTP